MQLLTRRLLRIWVVLALPAAAFCLYAAYGKNESMKTFQAASEYWRQAYEQTRTTGVRGFMDPVIESGRAMQNYNDAGTARDYYLLVALALLTLPVTYLLTRSIIRWIWRDPATTQSELSQGRKNQNWKEYFARRRPWPAIAAVALTIGMLIYSPAKAIGIIVSVVIQVALIGVAIWLFRHFQK